MGTSEQDRQVFIDVMGRCSEEEVRSVMRFLVGNKFDLSSSGLSRYSPAGPDQLQAAVTALAGRTS